MCVIVIDFISFCDFSNGVWNCSDGLFFFTFTQQKQQTNKQTKKEKKKKLWQNGKGEILQIHTS